jgi:hypothetical protein
MSRTRTYNLRTRADAGSVNQFQSQDASTLRRAPIISPIPDHRPHVLGSGSLIGSPAPLYSDVVASRNSSPVRDSPPVVITQAEVVPVVCEPAIGSLEPEIRIEPTISRENIQNIE